MNALSMMISIMTRSRLPELMSLFEQQALKPGMVCLGHGTAANETAALLGLENSEKAVCFNFVTEEKWQTIKRELERRIRIDIPGTGIAFTVPISSVGGRRTLDFLTQGQAYERQEEQEMKGTSRELLVVIGNQGYSETVMEAARSAGAGGGTVVHARGTGMQSAEKFFGVSLASEKDIIFIVSATSRKNQIMEAVMKQTGPGTPAGAIIFSLPVTDTAGLKLLEEEEKETEEA